MKFKKINLSLLSLCFNIILLYVYFFQDIARQLRPHTIRARYGKNKVQNAVHVTDLPEDALLEVKKFNFLYQIVIFNKLLLKISLSMKENSGCVLFLH